MLRKSTRHSAQFTKTPRSGSGTNGVHNSKKEKESDFRIQSNIAPLNDQESGIDWNEELELLFMQSFFTSGTFYKPTGNNKHFNMLIAYSRFMDIVKKPVDVNVLWSKLRTFFNLETLDSINNSTTEDRDLKSQLPTGEFSLNHPDFERLIKEKMTKYEGRGSVDSNASSPSSSRASSPFEPPKKNSAKKADKRSSTSGRKRR